MISLQNVLATRYIKLLYRFHGFFAVRRGKKKTSHKTSKKAKQKSLMQKQITFDMKSQISKGYEEKVTELGKN